EPSVRPRRPEGGKRMGQALLMRMGYFRRNARRAREVRRPVPRVVWVGLVPHLRNERELAAAAKSTWRRHESLLREYERRCKAALRRIYGSRWAEVYACRTML